MRSAGARGTGSPTGITADFPGATYAEAHQVLEDLAALGIDYADVVQVLEDEGVAKFDARREELAGTPAAGLHDLSAERVER